MCITYSSKEHSVTNILQIAFVLVIGVLEICENFNATILKNWIVKVIADYFYKQYNIPEVKSCFSSGHQQDIEEFKPYHLPFVEKLKAFYLTL